MDTIAKDLLEIFISAWVLGFILTLPREGRLRKFQVHVPTWLQRVLFLICKKSTIDIVGVVWQIMVYITMISLFLAYRFNIITSLHLLKEYFILIVGSMFLVVLIIFIVEVILYQKRKIGKHRNL